MCEYKEEYNRKTRIYRVYTLYTCVPKYLHKHRRPVRRNFMNEIIIHAQNELNPPLKINTEYIYMHGLSYYSIHIPPVAPRYLL